MSISSRDREILDAMDSARQQREELADLLHFYSDLFEVQFKAKADAPEPVVRDEMAIRWRMEGGIPQLTFDQLHLQPERFAQVVSWVVDVLCRHNPTWHVEPAGWSSEELIDQAQTVFESWPTLTVPEIDVGELNDEQAATDYVKALAVGFALAPYLQVAAENILPHLDLSLWPNGYCPVCGGRPNFSLLEKERGARQLVCARCNATWNHARVGCPFCKSTEGQQYYSDETGLYRLYVCSDCKAYLKTMDLRPVYRDVFPEVERLLTVGMDLAAQQEGFGNE